jgi:hypothetical protein
VDTTRFQALLSIFQFPTAQELIIQEDDRTPGWTVQSKFRDTLTAAIANRQGRALVIVHYAGHGLVDADGVFHLAEKITGNRKLDFRLFLLSWALPTQYIMEGVDNVDVLFILDCCFAHTVTRAPVVAPRIVEIIAATEDNTPRAYSPPANTFTSKLLSEISLRLRNGHKYVEFAEIIETLRSRAQARVKPCHALKMGMASICLPFTGVCPVDPTTIKPKVRAVFGVNIDQDISPEDLRRLTDWIRTVPENVSLSLEGVYSADSTYLILTAAYSVFSKLAGVGGYILIKEVRGPNMRASVPPATPSGQENVPFSKRPRTK